ncbi:alpha-L-fucosidase [Streptomyces europaeiscabiei]|uniref:alpha-L-fucosidase n=1 Tax=Streptomyces europaeiscabiei TaxID=146819 RepID=UPI0029AB9D82|nr:alpha-L-fucosidase [Streptomyces europaeiscabiei]MDX2527310.1 alpha-L-fucosidase [Streptomyces europaeiscabiei]
MAVNRRHFMTTAAALGGAVLLAPPGTAQALAGTAVRGGTGTPDYQPTKASLDTHPVPRWYKDAKFGIFVHWGIYSVIAGATPRSASEWYLWYQSTKDTAEWKYHRDTYGEDVTYDDLIPRFKAEKYDPDAWVRLFEQAGAEYFALTSKHHDGFALYPSRVTDRHSVAYGPKRDLVGELMTAARKRGTVRPGLYYSLGEYFNPAIGRPMRNFYTDKEIPMTGYKPVQDYVGDYELKQLYEIIDRYDPELLWADGQWFRPTGNPPWRSEEPMAHYYNQAKNRKRPKGVVINDRFDTHFDFATYEQRTNPTMDPQKWECCMTMGYSWGYNKHEPDEDYKTSEFLIQLLADVVSKNGNLLLNIGPRPDGTIPEIMQERLRDIGAWLKVNGPAIYGSTPWVRAEEEGSPLGIRYTVTPGKFNIIVLGAPSGTLSVPGDIPISATSRIRLLGTSGSLRWTRRDGKINITVPSSLPSDIANVFTVDWAR